MWMQSFETITDEWNKWDALYWFDAIEFVIFFIWRQIEAYGKQLLDRKM